MTIAPAPVFLTRRQKYLVGLAVVATFSVQVYLQSNLDVLARGLAGTGVKALAGVNFIVVCLAAWAYRKPSGGTIVLWAVGIDAALTILIAAIVLVCAHHSHP